MKRFSFLLLTLLMLLFAGCGTVDTSDTADDAPVKDDPPQEESTPVQEDQSVLDSQIEETFSAPIQVLLARHSDETKTDSGDLLCSAVWETAALTDESAAKYPDLARSLQDFSTGSDVLGRDFLERMTPYAQEQFESMPEYFNGYTSESFLCVERADMRIFSIRVDENQYTGGAHGNYWVRGMNIDCQTGKILELADVFVDTEGLVALLNDALLEKFPVEAFFDSEPLAGYDSEYFKASAAWTVDHQGVTFYFNPYEIGPYAAGIFSVALRFDQMPKLFNPQYTAQDDTWVKMMPERGTTEVYLGGVRKDLSVYVNRFEGKVSVLFVCGEDRYDLTECAGKNVTAYLVHTDGTYFLCVSALQEGVTRFYTYDLDGTLREDVDAGSLVGVWRTQT